ncbi:MAG: hypothetical protein JKY02_04240 [Flavobacteriaceae bacterium]|nr:hypothetical protein [Flavobacteriaceae bacterium]
MDALFNNLFIYEIILLFLGVFLFMILSISFVYYIIKGKEIKKLLFFFMIPIIMIGYPSIQEIQIEKDKIAFTKYKERIKENPNDSIAIEKTEELVEKLESRASTPKDMAQISEAYLLLDKPEKAIVLADKAIAKEKSNLTEESVGKDPVNEINKKSWVTTLVGYKEAATLQKDIKTNRISIQDTFQIKKRLNDIDALNSNTRKYLNKKYLSKKRIKKEGMNQ